MSHLRIVAILAGLALLAMLAVPAGAVSVPQLEWIQTYDSPAHDYDTGRGVAVDGAGNVYVTGYEDRPDLGQYANIWLRKYDTDGNTLWTQTYDSPAHYGDLGYGVAVDAAGNVYVTGYEERYDLDQSENIILLKYSQVPEPGTLALIAPALLGFAGVAFRKMRRGRN